MKKTVLILALTAVTLFAQTNDGPVITAIDGYAARVGSEIITYGEIRESVAPFMQQLFQRYQGEELALQIQKAHLEAREVQIEEALLREEAKRLGLRLPERVIDEEVDRMIRERFENDLAQLSRALASQRMTFDEWREEIRGQITVRVYYSREVVRRAKVSSEAVRAAYRENKEDYFIPFKVKFRAILINKGTSDADREVKEQQAREVLQKLQDGADFAEVAREVSEGIRAEQGGAFPWSDLEDIRKELCPALVAVSAGKISDLIETDEEFYIVKVEERRTEGHVPFEDVKEQLEKEELARDQSRVHRELINRLSKRHFVERY